jgi:CheY-like chemotaxis protein
MAPDTPLKILVIDDAPSFVSGLVGLLHRDGHTVETAVNGQLAWQQLQTRRYDVLLCDLLMPALDGPAFSACLRRQDPPLGQRVIFLTGGIPCMPTARRSWSAVADRGCPSRAAAVRSTMQQLLRAATPQQATNGEAGPFPRHTALV